MNEEQATKLILAVRDLVVTIRNTGILLFIGLVFIWLGIPSAYVKRRD